MLSTEPFISENSDYYIHTASTQARSSFFYPLCVGYFYYEPGYYLTRKTYDSFLILLVKKGSCIVKIGSSTTVAEKDQIVMLDCYRPHTYYTSTECEVEWIHFDGIAARQYYNLIVQSAGNFITLKRLQPFENTLHKIYLSFRQKTPTKEPLFSKLITDLLTELLLYQEQPQSAQQSNTDCIEAITSYIAENHSSSITLETLSGLASLSPYYFTRLFKKETGFTPHEYIIATRLDTAKFLLKNTNQSIKSICFSCGFSNESSFCSTFKKWMHTTPSAYRSQSG